MDTKTSDELKRITLNLPKNLGSKLLSKEVNTKNEEIMIDYLRKNSHTMPKEKVQEIRKLIEIGAFRTVSDIEDDNVKKEIELYYDREIKKSKKKGKLKDPRKDPFFMRMMAGGKKKEVSWRPAYCGTCGRDAERVPEHRVKEIEAGLSCRNCHPEHFQ